MVEYNLMTSVWALGDDAPKEPGESEPAGKSPAPAEDDPAGGIPKEPALDADGTLPVFQVPTPHHY